MIEAYILIELSSGSKYKYVRDIVNDTNGENEKFYSYIGPGYQEVGLKRKHGAMDSGLSPDETYYFKVNIDAGGEVEYSITPKLETVGFVSFHQIINLINNEILADGVKCKLVPRTGDLRFSSLGLVAALETTEVICPADSSRSLSGKYWTLNNANNVIAYYVWYFIPAKSEVTNLVFTNDSGNNNDNYGGFYVDLYVGAALHRFWWDVGDSDTPPSDGGGTLHEIDIINTDIAAAVAEKTSIIINTVTGLSENWTAGDNFDVTHAAGDITDGSDNCIVLATSITTQGADESADPAPGGTGIKITIAEDEVADDVASNTKDKIDLLSDFDASALTDTVTITNTKTGPTTDAANVNAGVSVNVTQQGITTSITLAAGTTGTNLFSSLNDWVAFDTAIPGDQYLDQLSVGKIKKDFTDLTANYSTASTFKDLLGFPESVGTITVLKRKNYENEINNETLVFIQIPCGEIVAINIIESVVSE